MPSWLRQCFDNHCCPNREGTVLTTSIHIITSVIGVGVLSLAWATAQLGWIAGPIITLLLAFVTCYTSQILIDCFDHNEGDPNEGNTYLDVVTAELGGFRGKLCGLVQSMTLFGAAVSYTIASSIRLANIERSICFHKHGVEHPCPIKRNRYMIAVGIIEILLFQILPPNHLGWISIVAAVMSLCYSSIEVSLGIAKIKAMRKISGSLTKISTNTVTPTQKLWGWLQALGVMAFAYEYCLVFPQIPGTIRYKKSVLKTMKKACLVSIPVATLVYMLSGCIGLAVSGDMVPRNLLTEFGFYNPYWLASIADGTLAIHLIGAFQVYCRPLFTFVEGKAENEFRLSQYKLFFFKLVWRTVFVIASTVTSLLLPFFIDIIGLLGALNFWLLRVYFPVEMYIKKEGIPEWSTKWALLRILSAVCLMVSVAATAGSFAGFVHDLKSYKPFSSGF